MKRGEDGNFRQDTEDFSDITEFFPERSAFTGEGGPVPMREEHTLNSLQKPWVILLILGTALLLGGSSVFLFYLACGNQKTALAEASSLIPESSFERSRSLPETETENADTAVTIPEKTKTPTAESSQETESGAGAETAQEETEAELVPEELTEPVPESSETGEEERVVDFGGVTFLLKNGEATLLRCSASDENMSFPDTIEGLPFEGVDDDAFRGCTHLVTIELPRSVCWIGAGAFTGCDRLTEVVLGSNVNAISEEAFSGVSGVTIVAPAGSYAQDYAEAHGLLFRASASEAEGDNE